MLSCHCEEGFFDEAISTTVREIATSQERASRNDKLSFGRRCALHLQDALHIGSCAIQPELQRTFNLYFLRAPVCTPQRRA